MSVSNTFKRMEKDSKVTIIKNSDLPDFIKDHNVIQVTQVLISDEYVREETEYKLSREMTPNMYRTEYFPPIMEYQSIVEYK